VPIHNTASETLLYARIDGQLMKLIRSRELDARSSRLVSLAHDDGGEAADTRGFGERRPRYQGPQSHTFGDARRQQREEISARGAQEVISQLLINHYCVNVQKVKVITWKRIVQSLRWSLGKE
jgi:hypothetical protein